MNVREEGDGGRPPDVLPDVQRQSGQLNVFPMASEEGGPSGTGILNGSEGMDWRCVER